MKRRKTTNEFINDAIKVHGNRYDYLKVEYVSTMSKVCIICHDHGEFWQTPSKHLQGRGCPKCFGKNKKTTEEFVRDAIEVHGNKYDYSKVEYVNALKKVCIICPEHGEFWQTANSHLRGYRCAKCSGKNKNTYGFITDAIKVHGDKYDYSNAEYINDRFKVCIICPEHGKFWQRASSHLQGVGCPKCKKSKGEILVSNILDGINIEYLEQYRVGKTRQKFDFFLPNNNVAIEYNGEQHYRPVGFFGGEDVFQYIKDRDKKKAEYCKENGINLIVIKYDETEDEIREKLKSLLI